MSDFKVQPRPDRDPKQSGQKISRHRAEPAAPFTVVRTDVSEVPPDMMEDGVPKADVLHQLPCYLGKGIKTAF